MGHGPLYTQVLDGLKASLVYKFYCRSTAYRNPEAPSSALTMHAQTRPIRVSLESVDWSQYLRVNKGGRVSDQCNVM